MHTNKELSDSIETLFSLDIDEFDPKIHLPLAEHVVDKLGKKKTYLVRLADILSLERNEPIIDHESERKGNFVLRHVGRIKGVHYLGFHPKIEIIYWKSELMRLSSLETETLEIGYEGKRVVGLHKYFKISKGIISIGPLDLYGTSLESQWIYKV